MSDEKPKAEQEQKERPAIDLGALSLSANDVVNGRWAGVPGFPGLEVRILHWRFQLWADWLDATRGQYDSEEDRERAFYGAVIVRDVTGLEEHGEPVVWTPEKGIELMTRSVDAKDETTGKPVKVYLLDQLFFWVRTFSQNTGNYAARLAGN